jgi:hypothetical protein
MSEVAPPVTVAMPVYNGEDYIDRALRALQAQEFADFELIIRDNASTDRTEEIAREFAASDPRIRYVRNPENIGGARNSNALLDDAQAPLIIWAYHDDEAHPKLLSDSVEKLADAGSRAVLAYPRVVLIDPEGRIVGRHDDADLDLRDPEPHARLARVLGRRIGQIQFGLMRTDAVRESGGVCVSTGGEFILPAAMALRGLCLLADADEPRLSIRQHEERSGGDRGSEAAWIDPSRPHIPFPYSRSNPLMLKTVADAPLTAAERRRSYGAVVRHWTIPDLRSVAGDIVRLPWDAGWIKR